MNEAEVRMAINRLMCGNTAHSKDASYIKLAIESLEKQIPKKPLNIEDKYWGCPCCYGLLMVRWITYPTNPVPLEAGRNYCEDCGQAIDWLDESEVEE